MVEKFIAQRLIGKGNVYRIAKPIMRIAIIGTAISVAVMLLTTFIVKGFQKEIREKIIAFSVHFQINAAQQFQKNQVNPVHLSDSMLTIISNMSGVSQVVPFVQLPGIIEGEESMSGIVLKGIDPNQSSSFLAENLKAGRLLSNDKECVLSEYITRQLKLEVNDDLFIYAFTEKQHLKPRKLKLVGIYNLSLIHI